MGNQPLNPKQRKFLRLYLGRDDRYSGNATQCYKVVYGCDNNKAAQTCGSRLLAHPVIAKEIEAWHKAQRDATLADAAFVLEQSVRLYDRAMGDESFEVDVIDKIKTDEGTIHRVRTISKRDHNPAIARQALELIGRHTSIQAFQDNVEHTHTHRLEQALARRGKLVEAKAEQRSIIDGRAQQVPDEEGTGVPGEEAPKGSIQAEVIETGHARASESAAERAGATGK